MHRGLSPRCISSALLLRILEVSAARGHGALLLCLSSFCIRLRQRGHTGHAVSRETACIRRAAAAAKDIDHTEEGDQEQSGDTHGDLFGEAVFSQEPVKSVLGVLLRPAPCAGCADLPQIRFFTG